MVVEGLLAGVSAAPTAGMECVGFAPSPWFTELTRAGAPDRVRELPPDATGHLSGFLTAGGRKPAAGAEK